MTPDGDGAACITIATSPCAAIYCLGYASRNQFHCDRAAADRGESGATVNTASFQVDRLGAGGFIRIQCADWQRRSAWSNPLYLE